MPDETVDLRFLAEQQARVLGELGEMREQTAQIPEMRAEQERLALLVGKVADAVTAVAATQNQHSQILTRHSKILEAMEEHDQLTGGRLNAIEARRARIEKHTGLVKA